MNAAPPAGSAKLGNIEMSEQRQLGGGSPTKHR
jgi:hypothetical protein